MHDFIQDTGERQIFVPPDGPPRTDRPPREIFACMGEENIRQMIRDFYDQLAISAIRELFNTNMTEAAERSADYFVQLLGGPACYTEKHGAPRLRARHLPFRITEADRAEWLRCFANVLEDAPGRYGFPPAHLDAFRTFLDAFSRWMVNTR